MGLFFFGIFERSGAWTVDSEGVEVEDGLE